MAACKSEKLSGGGRLIALLAAMLLAFAAVGLIPAGKAQAKTVPLKYAIEINVHAGDAGLGVVQFEDENGNWIRLGQGESRTVMVDAGGEFSLTATPGNEGQFDFIRFDGVLMDIGSDQSNWTSAYNRDLDSVDRNHRYDFAFVNRSAHFAGIPETIGEDEDDPFTVGMAYRVTGSPTFGEWDMNESPLVQLYDGRDIDLSDGTVWIRALKPGTTTAIYGGGNRFPPPKDVAITIGASEPGEHYIFALAHVGGQIDLPGNQKVTEGDSKTFTVMPDNGYWIEEVWVDGSRLTLTDAERKGNYAHTFTNVQGPHDIVAMFTEAAELTMVDRLEGFAGDTIRNVEPNPNYGAWIYDNEYLDIERRLEGGDWVFDLHLKKAIDNLPLTYKVKDMEKTIPLKINRSPVVTATAGAGGSIDPGGEVSVLKDTNKTFAIKPEKGYAIDKVLVDNVDVTNTLVDNKYTFTTVNSDHTISASFVKITDIEDKAMFVGESVSMTPLPAGGVWTYDNTALSLSEQNGIATFTGLKAGSTTVSYAVNGGVCTATITVKPVHTITASAGQGGSISPEGSVKVKDGENQAFTVTPDPLMMIDTLLVDGKDVASQMQGSSYAFTAVDRNHIISATFKTLVIEDIPADFELPLGSSVDFKPAPLGGTWTVDDNTILSLTEQGGTATLTGLKLGATKVTYTVNGVSHEVLVTVVPASYTIKATASTGGSINPLDNVVVAYGADQTFTMTPDAGWRLTKVLVDGEEVAAEPKGTTYTFKKVRANHTIEAVFTQELLADTGDTALPGALLGIGVIAGIGALAVRRKLYRA